MKREKTKTLAGRFIISKSKHRKGGFYTEEELANFLKEFERFQEQMKRDMKGYSYFTFIDEFLASHSGPSQPQEQVNKGTELPPVENKEQEQPVQSAEEIAEKLTKQHSDFNKEGFSEYFNGYFNGIIKGVEFANQKQSVVLPSELLEIFKAECLKYPDETAAECWELAKGWYELRDFKNDPLPKGGIKL